MQNRLIEYLPQFLQEIKEFKTIAKSIAPFLDEINESTEAILQDMFIKTATEKAIEHYEKMLSISSSFADDLENRKFRLLAKYNETLPYTYQNLSDIITNLLGERAYDMSLDYDKRTLYLKINLSHKNFLKDITELLERIVPMNISLDIGLNYNTWDVFKTKTYGEIQKLKKTWKEMKEEVF